MIIVTVLLTFYIDFKVRISYIDVMMNLKKLINKTGGPSYWGKKLGISHSAVCQWKQVPPKWVVEVEHMTGIPREELRPDIFKKIQGS